MLRYMVLRLARTGLVVVAITTIVFFVSRLTGDPANVMLGSQATEADIQTYRHLMGWDQPLPLQYLRFLTTAWRGDFGQSFYYRTPAFDLVLERLPATLALAMAAMAFAAGLGVLLGVLAAVHRGTLLDRLVMSLAILGRSLPVFWVAILLIFFLAAQVRLFPVSGADSPLGLVLPALSLGVVQAAEVARLTRSAMVEVLAREYMRTGRAKGLAGWVLLRRHALRNALNPILTILSLQFGGLLGGAVVTETIFAWPGLGRLTVSAILVRDFPVVQAAVFLFALGFALINLAVDLLYPVVDPRIRTA
jgi:ABC-type dipeptide/oligopeptide/nickel transport system permease component